MILIVLALACVISVPLTGGNISRLTDIRLKALWIPVLSLVLQVFITTITPNGHPTLHAGIHIATYVLLGCFLVLNRRLPGIWVMTLGTLCNGLAITLNGGIMPAARAAERMAGLRLGHGFNNSAPVAHPIALWLGDIIPWPGPLPNVLSAGDCLIFAGTVYFLFRTCRRPAPAPAVRPPALSAP